MFSELYLTDGNTKIDLLGGNKNGFGISLERMTFSRAQQEPSGAFRQAYGSAVDSYELIISAPSQDEAAVYQQRLDRMLEKAYNYFSGSSEEELVWICSRTREETNHRYAIVYKGTIEKYDDVFSQSFSGPPVATMREIVLGLERSVWLSNPPLEPSCIALDNTVQYNPSLTTWSSVRSITNVQQLYAVSSTIILAASNLIDRSTDSGTSWTTELTTGVANLRFWMFAASTGGRIWTVAGLTTGAAGATSGIYFSDNNGDTWTQHTASVNFYSVVYRSSDDTLFFGGEGEIRYIQGSGSLSILSTLPEGKMKAMALSSENTVIAADEYTVWRIPNNELSLYISSADDVGPFLHALAVQDYVILASATFLSISRDDGNIFEIYWRDWGVDSIFLLEAGEILMGQSSTANLFVSRDGGFSMVQSATMAASPIRSISELAGAYLFAAAGNAVYRRISMDSEVTYGPYNTDCFSEILVANHRLESNWTHIFIFDTSAGTYTLVTPANIRSNLENNTDQLMFPSPVGVGDIFYVGLQTTSPDSGAFSNLQIEMTDLNYTLTLAIEYWSGAAWTAFTISELRDNTQSLHRSGSLVWHNVALGSTAINSVTAYWIRFRVTATGTLSTLLPKVKNIYIAQQPFVEINNIAGDIPAIAQALLYNRLDDGNGNAPSLPTGRVLMGLRSVDRGGDFTAYLNLSDVQNPPGVSITLASEVAYVTDRVIAAAGRFAQYTPVSLNVWNRRITVQLDSDLSRDFNGTFQVYLRYAYSGFSDTVYARFALENFVNQGTILGDEIPLLPVFTNDIADIAYLGQFSIMPERFMNISDRSSAVGLGIEFKSSSAGVGSAVDCFEIILIPADEWIGEFFDPLELGGAGLERFIDIDSASFPKKVLKCTLRNRGSELVSGIWNSSASGVFMLQPGTRQRLWFLASQINEGDESLGSSHTLVHHIRMLHHSRWLGLRGND